MDALRKLSAEVNKFAKISALISSLSGILMIIIFLVGTEAPLPPVDASFGATVTMFMFYIFIYLVICVSASLFPAFTTPARNKTAKRAYSFMSNPIYRYGDREKLSILLYRIRTYIFFFLPFISTNIVLFWMYLAGGDPSGSEILSLLSCVFLASICISARTTYYDIRKVTTLEKLEFLDFMKSIFISNIMSIFWFFFFYIIITKISMDSLEDANDSIRDAIFFAITMIFHFSLCSSAPSLRSLAIISICSGYLLFVVSPGINVSTSYILKTMGSGGSSPVSIYIKEPAENGRARIIKLNGCLMFSTASFAVIKTGRSGDFKDEYCNIQSGLFYLKNGRALPSTNSVFSRSDIYKISDIE